VLCRKTETQQKSPRSPFSWVYTIPNAGGQARRDHIYEEFERGGLKGCCEQCGLKGKVEPPRVEKIRFPFCKGQLGYLPILDLNIFFKTREQWGIHSREKNSPGICMGWTSWQDVSSFGQL
jgi:hypothetical protein